METNSAIYPGSYDPLTNGHIDIIQRGMKIFPRIIVAVLKNPTKSYLFGLEERVEILKSVFGQNPRIEIDCFGGLLVDYLKAKECNTIVRGLRAISDFDIEFQMALMNRKIEPRIETIFVMPNEQFSYTSSTLVKQVAKYGGDVAHFVPPNVAKALQSAYANKAAPV